MINTLLKIILFIHEFTAALWIGGVIIITIISPIVNKKKDLAEIIYPKLFSYQNTILSLAIISGIPIIANILTKSGIFSSYFLLLILKMTLALMLVFLTFISKSDYNNLFFNKLSKQPKKIAPFIKILIVIIGITIFIISALL